MKTPQCPMLNEAECLHRIASEGYDAEELLLDYMPTAIRRFKAIDKRLRHLLAETRQVFPDARYYTASGGFNLMLGSPHSSHGRPQQQLIAIKGQAQIDDGDF